MQFIQLELKYCERCGGLWFRQQGSPDVYCATCAIPMAQVAMPSKTRRKPRMPIHEGFDLEGMGISLWMEEGRA